MRKMTSMVTVSLFICLLAVMPLPAQNQEESQDQTKWIADSLKEIQTIKVGMTRGDLLKVFTTEGGLSTGLQRTYVYRKCPYIKVDVKFEAVGRPAKDADGRVTLVEANADVIKTISRPYLEWSVMD